MDFKNVLIIAVGAAAIGVIATASLSGTSVANIVTPKEEQKIQESLSKPGTLSLYSPCKRDSECLGGTNVFGVGNSVRCDGGQCIPLVRKDDGSPTQWLPSELGLRRSCGKYIFAGDGMRCSSDAQCGNTPSGKYVEANDSTRSATVSSKTYCSTVGGFCRTKGQNPLGTYYKHHDDDPLSGSDVQWPQDEARGDYIRENIDFIKANKASCPDIKNEIGRPFAQYV
jgi:hypothetical protein